MEIYLGPDAVRRELRMRMHASGLTDSEWARKNKVNKNDLSDFLCKRKVCGPDIRRVLGLERMVVFKKKKK